MHNPISIVGNVRDITKCKIIEEELSITNKELAEKIAESSIKLKEALENYKNLIDITNTGYLVLDEKGFVLYANPEYVHMSGHRSLQDILGRNMIEWTADYQKDEIAKKLKNCATQESLGTVNVDYKDKKGKISMIEIKTNIYKTEEGIRIIGICHDVSKHKKIVQNLRKSEQRLQKFMDSATEGFVILDSKMNFISVNKFALQVVGMSREEIIGKNLLELIPNLRETGRYDKYLNVIKTEKPISFNEVNFNKQDGTLSFYLSIKAFKVGDNVGMMFTDITERKKMESELKNIKWLLNRRKDSLKPQIPIYGDLSEINTSREILDSVGKEMLTEIARDYLDLLNTSAVIYEKNGDYALGIFSSNWCQFLDESSRKICNTIDNKEALSCGKWHCHESCWTETSKISIETGKPFDKECEGGLHIYAIPVWVEGDIVGSINVGYGDPPKDIKKLTEIAEKYEVRLDKLLEYADSYKTRPEFIIDNAKKRLHTSAMVIGAMIERKRIEHKLKKSEKNLRESEGQLRKLNKELEGRITAGTEELKESEEKHKTILDSIVTGVWVADKDDIMYYSNKHMLKIAGTPFE